MPQAPSGTAVQDHMKRSIDDYMMAPVRRQAPPSRQTTSVPAKPADDNCPFDVPPLGPDDGEAPESAGDNLAPSGVEGLVVQARACLAAGDRSWKAMTAHSVELGRVLIEIKKQKKRGEFIPFVETRIGISKWTAQGCMRLYRHRDKIDYTRGFRSALTNLSKPSKAPKLPDQPDQKRDDITLYSDQATNPPSKALPAPESQPAAKPPVPPPAAPSGGCRINGVLTSDTPEIAKERAAGRIPAGNIVEISVPDKPDTLQDVQAEHQQAKKAQQQAEDALSDSDWLESLPLAAVLEGPQLRRFKADALAYRHLRTERERWGRALAAYRNKCRDTGPYLWLLTTGLKCGHPRTWAKCVDAFNGGCSGAGTVRTGECPACRGAGYRAKEFRS